MRKIIVEEKGMRQYNFRGKSIAEEWHYGLLAQSAGFPGQPTAGMYISNTVGLPYAYQVVPESVGEFIGKTDSEKNEIYEGDIVKRAGGSTYKIEYSERGAGYRLIPIIARYPMTFFELESVEDIVEIIGNIYDNPEMLEDTNNDM